MLASSIASAHHVSGATGTSTSTASHSVIPPSPRKSVAVAAPKRSRPTAGHLVLNADAASRKRKAARPGRDKLAGARASSSSKAGCPTAIASSNCESAAVPGADRLAVALQTGKTASPADRNALAPAKSVAASVDAPQKIVAGTAPMGSGRTTEDACADAALSRRNKNEFTTAMTRANTQEENDKKSLELEALKVPTDPEALVDGPAYVRSVALHVDLVGASARLVVSGDEKVSKAELDRLRELIFGKGGPSPADDVLRIDWTGVPRPERERQKFNEE
jgi:hypothetical protein